MKENYLKNIGQIKRKKTLLKKCLVKSDFILMVGLIQLILMLMKRGSYNKYIWYKEGFDSPLYFQLNKGDEYNE